MPIFEYGCKTCGNGFDKFIRGYNSPIDVACPACEGVEVERKMSAVGVTGVWQSNVPDFKMPKPIQVRPDDPFRCIA